MFYSGKLYFCLGVLPDDYPLYQFIAHGKWGHVQLIKYQFNQDALHVIVLMSECGFSPMLVNCMALAMTISGPLSASRPIHSFIFLTLVVIWSLIAALWGPVKETGPKAPPDGTQAYGKMIPSASGRWGSQWRTRQPERFLIWL